MVDNTQYHVSYIKVILYLLQKRLADFGVGRSFIYSERQGVNAIILITQDAIIKLNVYDIVPKRQQLSHTLYHIKVARMSGVSLDKMHI